MQEQKVMNVEETIEEIKFAIEHGFSFTKHNLILLSHDDIQQVVNELDITASIEATILEEGSRKRGYYALSFGGIPAIATYFSVNVIDSRNDARFVPENSEEAIDAPF